MDYALEGRLAGSRQRLLIAIIVDTVTALKQTPRTGVARRDRAAAARACFSLNHPRLRGGGPVMQPEVRTTLTTPDAWIVIIDRTPNGKVSVSSSLRCPTHSNLDRKQAMFDPRTARVASA